MKNEIRLAINKNVDVRAFTHEVFINSIINNENTTSTEIAKIDVEDYQSFKWNKSLINMEVKVNDSILAFHGRKYESNMESVFTRKLENNETIIVKIETQTMLRNWGYIYVFIKDERVDINKTEQVYGFLRFCNGFYKRINDSYVESIPLRSEYKQINCPCYIKLSFINRKLNTYISKNKTKWKCVFSDVVDIDTENLEFGFGLNAGEYQYYNWLFTNYIQIRVDEELQFPIEYIVSPIKIWKFYTVHPLLDFIRVKRRDLISSNVNIISFIRKHICLKRYIEFTLDERYFNENSEEKVVRSHQSLVYGFNHKKSTIYALSFNQNGLPVEIEIKYIDFIKAYEDKEALDCIYLLFLTGEGEDYKFNLKFVCNSIIEYLNGTDSSFHFAGMVSSKENISGINILNQLIGNHDFFNKFLVDVRFVYTLYEHKVIMSERLMFLEDRGIVDKEEISDLKMKFNELMQLNIILKNSVIRNIVKPSKMKEENIKKLIIEIKYKDELAMNKLYQLLYLKQNGILSD